MNGECKSFRLNDPMTWKEFKAMPDDIKVVYIKQIRLKYGATDRAIAEMLRTNVCSFSQEINRLGITKGRHTGAGAKWDKEGFYAWMHGVEKLPTPVPEEPVEEPIQEEPEVFVEDDLPFEEPEPFTDEKILTGIYPSQAELLKAELKAKEENIWLRNELKSAQMQIQILQAQMDVVRMIFGGKSHG